MFRRYDLQTDILLAVMPAVATIILLLLLNTFGKQEILFSSLASSAFLIYLEPEHPTNNVRTLLIAQLSAAVIGYLVYRIVGAGYTSAAISMIIAIAVMIAAKAMHPPAVATALVFAFQHAKPNTLLMFFVAVFFLVILIVLQRTSLWLIKRSTNKKEFNERAG
ncbi:MAG: HPP family protein [Bacteroidota bacterium]|nr:HPP family protein [Bacteroidota bacterium]